jgi:hypothetical protein
MDGRVENEVVLSLEQMPAMTDGELFVDGKFAGGLPDVEVRRRRSQAEAEVGPGRRDVLVPDESPR